MKCPNKKYKFYQDLLKAFKAKNPNASDEALDKMAFEIWYRTDLPSFKKWYGGGEVDIFKNPILRSDNTYKNDKGDIISIFDFGNTKSFTTGNKVDTIVSKIDSEINAYKGIIIKIKDSIVRQTRLLRDASKDEQAIALNDLWKTIDVNLSREGIALFIKNAAQEVGKSYKRILELQETNALTIANLRTAIRYVAAYDTLNDIKKVQRRHADIISPSDLATINDIISMRDEINDIWEDNVDDLVVKELAPLLVHSTPEQVKQLLQNSQDIGQLQTVTAYAGDSTHPIVAATAKLIDNAQQDTIHEQRTFMATNTKLAKPIENSSLYKANPEKMWDSILEKDINGKKTGFLISPYKIGEFQAKRQEFFDRMDKVGDKDSKEFDNIQQEYFKWLRANTIQKYKVTYYDTLNTLSKEAREARDEFRLAKDEILDKYKEAKVTHEGTTFSTIDYSKITDEDWAQIQELESKLNQLKNLFYVDSGLEKTGEDLEIAKNLRKYSKEIGKFFEKVAFNKSGFEAGRAEAEAKGAEALEQWKERNTHTENTEAFWTEFNRVVNLLRSSESEDIAEKINSLTKDYKDENGVINGDIIPAHIVNKINELLTERSIINAANKGVGRTKQQIEAAQAFKKLVKFVPTEYYLQVYADKKASLSDSEFAVWHAANHIIDEDGKATPTYVWTTMLPKDKKHIKEETPNNSWYLTGIKKEFRNPEYYDKDDNIIGEDDLGRALPTSVWKNADYTKFMAKGDKDMIAYHKFFTESKEEQESWLPVGERTGKYQLPAIRKGGLERIITGGIENIGRTTKEELKSKLQRREGDTDFGQPVDNRGNTISRVPVFFNSRIEPHEMSYDLVALANSYHMMALNYKNMIQVVDTVETVKDLLRSGTVTTSRAGSIIKDRNKRLLNPEIRKSGENSNALKLLTEFVDMQVYGKTNKDLGTFNTWFMANVDVARSLGLLQSATSLSILGFNITGATVNAFIEQMNSWIEATGGEFFNKKELLWGNQEYGKHIPGMMKDIGSLDPQDKITNILVHFDVVTSLEREVKPRGSNRLSRLAKTESAYFMYGMGEHASHSITTIAALKHIVPLDKEGNKIPTLTNMYDAITFKDGSIVVDPRVANFGDKEQKDFTRLVNFISRKKSGNYNSRTAAIWQADARWRIVGSMRKWITDTVAKRWDYRKNNEMSGTKTEGFYRTTGRFIREYMKGVKQHGFNVASEEWDNLTAAEKANIHRTTAEMAMFALAFGMSALLYGLAGGNDKDKRKNHTAYLFFAYQAFRLRQELTQYINPMSAMNVLRSPAASMTIIQSVYVLLAQLYNDPTGRYTTSHRKGELRIQKDIEDILPFIKQVKRGLTNEGLEDQLNFLTMKQRVTK